MNSYASIERFAKRHQGTTLVLFDYHHDVGPVDTSILSSNWVGKLLSDGTVARVLWVSGRDLEIPNKNARRAWLARSLATFPPDEARKISDRLILSDWHELENTQIKGPLIVSFDLDTLCHDPGESPERFTDEIASWIAREKPALVTVALSAAYQKDAASGWQYLARFAERYGKLEPRASWFLEAGTYGARAEGAEESDAWLRWKTEKEKFGHRGTAFFPGAANWITAPSDVRVILLDRSVRAGDPAANDVISGWRDPELAGVERNYPEEETDRLLAAAAAAIESYLRGVTERNFLSTIARETRAVESNPYDKYGKDPGSFGIAVRLQSDGVDRGCLAILRGVRDPVPAVVHCARSAMNDPRYPAVHKEERACLDLEIAVFGAWQSMKGPLDFRPGLDSLLLINDGETTLLQAPVAAEKGFDRVAFLSRLSNKAGLGPDGWKITGLRFERAPTVWSRQPLSAIESSNAYQKYEKK